MNKLSKKRANAKSSQNQLLIKVASKEGERKTGRYTEQRERKKDSVREREREIHEFRGSAGKI